MTERVREGKARGQKARGDSEQGAVSEEVAGGHSRGTDCTKCCCPQHWPRNTATLHARTMVTTALHSPRGKDQCSLWWLECVSCKSCVGIPHCTILWVQAALYHWPLGRANSQPLYQSPAAARRIQGQGLYTALAVKSTLPHTSHLSLSYVTSHATKQVLFLQRWWK